MITIESIVGNIRRDHHLRRRYEEMSARSLAEAVRISRMESQRVRMRKVSSKGTDVAITLPSGTKLRHGDVLLLANDRMITLELEPENVAMVEVGENLHEDDLVAVPVRIGHTIGNLHRPIRAEGRRIYFPIQADSEIDMFKKMFGPLLDHLTISKTRMVFEPAEGMDAHEH
jgi:urease accessory protein